MLPAKFVFWKFDFESGSISSFSFSLFSEGSDDEGDKGGVPEKKIISRIKESEYVVYKTFYNLELV